MIRIASNQCCRRRHWEKVSASVYDYSNILAIKAPDKEDNDNGSPTFSTDTCQFQSAMKFKSSQNHTFASYSYQKSAFRTTSRNFSSSVKDSNSNDGDGTFYDLNNGSNLPTFEESLATLSEKPIADNINVDLVDSITSSAAPVPVFESTWYSFSDQAVNLVQFVHETTGLPYATTIFAVTLSLRMTLFPLAVMTQRNMSRMAHMQPELAVVTEKMKALNTDSSMEERTRLQRHYYSLMQKYDCNPLKSVVLMLAQFPIFVGMFFGLQKMPEFYPELSTGGLWWFTDLTISDPYYILPCITAATFIAGVEVNKALTLASNPSQGPIMINVMRGMGLLMIPMTSYFPSIVFCYWVANNSFTFLQMMTFKQPMIRNFLGIWEAPKSLPQKNKGVSEMYEDWSSNRSKEQTEKDKKKKILEHNKRIARSPRRRKK